MNKKLNEIIVLEKIYLLREAKKKHKIFKKIKIANTEFLISKN